ncbi:hypothetical protein [Chryseobacterium taklimakanense]|nr:hypothetical protein [Chryseobacterium taklimakanense]
MKIREIRERKKLCAIQIIEKRKLAQISQILTYYQIIVIFAENNAD